MGKKMEGVLQGMIHRSGCSRLCFTVKNNIPQRSNLRLLKLMLLNILDESNPLLDNLEDRELIRQP